MPQSEPVPRMQYGFFLWHEGIACLAVKGLFSFPGTDVAGNALIAGQRMLTASEADPRFSWF